MTSPPHHTETHAFFLEHAYFGLREEQISFFAQEMWPLLDEEGNLLLDREGKIAYGPNGNGSLFRAGREGGLWERWRKMGIEHIQVMPIDNPLALPFDPTLLGMHIRRSADLSLRVVHKREAGERVGVLAKQQGRATIVEYFEMEERDRVATDREGRLVYGLANIGIYCFSHAFLQKMTHLSLPIHATQKRVPHTDLFAWKCEEFIFDVLPYADTIQALLSPREHCFAPLKSTSGEESIERVQSALQAFDRAVWRDLTGLSSIPDIPFELAPTFYYPTPALRAAWRGKSLPHKEYIDE
jgi:UDP-N-acetylglucosamine/UDP-N-acetylgalactosamine diphosphorylase